jgi:hypothetical protein
LRRIDVAVYREGILVVGDVIEATAQCPIKTERMKPLF